MGSGGATDTHDQANTASPVIVIGRKGSVGSIQWFNESVFTIDTAYFVDPASTTVDLRWLYYVLQTVDFQTSSQDVGVPGLSRDWAYSQVVPVPPPVEEQRRIADFLDDQVVQVQGLIDLRRLHAAATHERFVFRRSQLLRGPEPHKHVGGWLGAAAEDWSLRRLGSVSRVHSGAGFPHEFQGLEEGQYPFVKVGDLGHANDQGVLTNADNWVSGATAHALGAKPAPVGSILFPKVGAALLTNRRVITGLPVVFDNNVMGLEFPNGDDRFCLHLMSEIDMVPLANPGPVPSLNADAVKSILVPWPKVSEQRKIAEQIDQEADLVSDIETIVHKQINLLEERKRALITAAVTGELDVTTAKPIGMGKWVPNVGASVEAPAAAQSSGIGGIG